MNLPVRHDGGLLLNPRKDESPFQVTLYEFCLAYFDSLHWVNVHFGAESGRSCQLPIYIYPLPDILIKVGSSCLYHSLRPVGMIGHDRASLLVLWYQLSKESFDIQFRVVPRVPTGLRASVRLIRRVGTV
jgi:hypothetical protein